MRRMAKEIERKFLVVKDDWRGMSRGSARIRQFYLATGPDRSMRVRLDGTGARLTLKFGAAGRERDEFEYPIPAGDAEEMAAFAVGAPIEKERYQVAHGGRLYEVDVFGGPLAGLVMAELETPDAVPSRELPDWLGREVTGDAAFYNASLARNGRPAATS